MALARISADGPLVARLSAAFILQAIQAARAGAEDLDNLLDTLIFAATLQANLGLVQSDLRLQAVHATMDTAPPDEVRRARAVSPHAVAGSLGLPYETVRRRVGRLLEAGRLAASEGGIWAPASAFARPAQVQANLDNYRLVRGFYLRLRGLGLLAPPRCAEPRTGDAPVLAVIRRLVDYVMRALESLRAGGADVVGVVVLLGVMREGADQAPLSFQPISALALSRRVGLPRETVRRHLSLLVDAGDCLRMENGFTAAAEGAAAALASPRNLADLRRMFAGLDDLGVLARWEREGPDAAPG